MIGYIRLVLSILLVSWTTTGSTNEGASSEQSVSRCEERTETDGAISDSKWRPGVDYVELVPRVGRPRSDGKVEVVELFLYTSPLSARFQSYLSEWFKDHSEQVDLFHRPAIVFPHARAEARMYYTLEQLGRADLHPLLFEWSSDTNRSIEYHGDDLNAVRKLNETFAVEHGISRSQFRRAYGSKEISLKVVNAEIRTHSFDVNGTPTVVVGGKYSTSLMRNVQSFSAPGSEQDFERLLRLIDYLIARAQDDQKHDASHQ